MKIATMSIKITCLIFLLPMLYSCNYYVVTKQSQLETTPTYEKDIVDAEGFPILQASSYVHSKSSASYEIVSVDKRPVQWTSKYQYITLTPGIHVIGIKFNIDYYKAFNTDRKTYHTFDAYGGHDITETTISSRQVNFKYQGSTTFDFKKRSKYIIENNGQYDQNNFRFNLRKFNYFEDTKMGGFLTVAGGIIGLVGLIIITIPYW